MLCRLLKATLLLILAGCSGRSEAPASAPPATADSPGADPAAGKPASSPEVKVELYVPLGPACHRKTIELVKEFAGKHGGRVRVAVLPMGDYKSDGQMRDRGITCATVLINGKFEFDLPDGKGGTRKAVFSHKPNEPDSTYRSEDVIDAIAQLLKA